MIEQKGRQDPRRAKELRHILGLHGTKGTEGLTGRYNGHYFENGRPRKAKLEIGGKTEIKFSGKAKG